MKRRPEDPGRGTRLAYSTAGEREVQAVATRSVVPPGQTRLRLERRAGNRVATLVTGLPGDEQAAAALARELKAACATGGAYKDQVLELQGDHRARVEELLAARGIRSKRAGG